MTRSIEISSRPAKLLAFLLSSIIFAIDLFTPISINISIFYACVIVILAWTQSPRWIWAWTALSVVLTAFAMVFSTDANLWVDILNRCITISMLVIVAGFVHFSILVSKQLDANKRLLAEIQERKRVQESLGKAQDELARISRVTTMGELAASIAHEINQPLSGILINGNASLRWLSRLQNDPQSLEEARRSTERILRDGKRAGEVITRLRNLFQHRSAAKSALHINEVIQEVVTLVKHDMEKKQVVLNMDLASQLPKVFADSIQLQQVILNLIMNGAEAMSNIQGRSRDLTIRTRLLDDLAVRVEVRDVGVGIETEKLDSIFNAFYTTKQGGMGMGLSISRTIIENHGGRLGIESNDGPGVTFHFTIMSSQGEGV